MTSSSNITARPNCNVPSQQSSRPLLEDTNKIGLLNGTPTEIFVDASETFLSELPYDIGSTTESFTETSEALMAFQDEVATMNTTLDTCQQLAELLLYMPFQHQLDSSLFSTDFIDLIRDTCTKYDINVKRKHKGVITGSATSLTGGALSIVGTALIPVTFGGSIVLMVFGGVTAAIGTVASIGFMVEKSCKDKKRKANVSPKLKEDEMQKYIKFEEDTAKAVTLIATIFSMIQSLRLSNKVVCNDILSDITAENVEDVKVLLEQDHNEKNVLKVLERILHHADSLIRRLHKMENALKSQGSSSPHKKISKSSLHNFDNVKNDPCTLLQKSLEALNDYLQEENVYPTFGTYLQRKFQVNEGGAASLGNNSKCAKTSSVHRSVFVMRGVAFLGRMLSPTFRYADDVAKFGAGIANTARVTSIAVGIVAGAAGVVIDSVFIVHAAYSLAKGKREKFFQHLVDIAESMEEVNQLVKSKDTTSDPNNNL